MKLVESILRESSELIKFKSSYKVVDGNAQLYFALDDGEVRVTLIDVMDKMLSTYINMNGFNDIAASIKNKKGFAYSSDGGPLVGRVSGSRITIQLSRITAEFDIATVAQAAQSLIKGK